VPRLAYLARFRGSFLPHFFCRYHLQKNAPQPPGRFPTNATPSSSTFSTRCIRHGTSRSPVLLAVDGSSLAPFWIFDDVHYSCLMGIQRRTIPYTRTAQFAFVQFVTTERGLSARLNNWFLHRFSRWTFWDAPLPVAWRFADGCGPHLPHRLYTHPPHLHYFWMVSLHLLLNLLPVVAFHLSSITLPLDRTSFPVQQFPTTTRRCLGSTAPGSRGL